MAENTEADTAIVQSSASAGYYRQPGYHLSVAVAYHGYQARLEAPATQVPVGKPKSATVISFSFFFRYANTIIALVNPTIALNNRNPFRMDGPTKS